ncbi:MAG TPA: class I fructose-bisphosphate aldolase [bacterium]|nr:class I fructose-bisphosphate aldolase [bacterium]
MNVNAMVETTRALTARGKGILAADESHGTIGKRFAAIGVENTPENRRRYRRLLFLAPGIADVLSGVILFDETIRQRADDGTPFPGLLTRLGIVPGIKVDAGAKPLAGAPGEQVTEGLDGLRERLAEYRGLGARFAKWRAVIEIGEGRPSGYCLAANAHALARYAALCQEADIVPIVEPEVLMDGGHTIEQCFDATQTAQDHLFRSLRDQRVVLEALLLKPNMVVSGAKCPRQAGVDEVAEATVRCLRRTVPAAVPGVMFLSGGQTPERATRHLNAMNAMPGTHPWVLSFSFARALQAPAMDTWRGSDAAVKGAQQAFLNRARLVSAARDGRYTPAMEQAAAV